MARYGRTDHGTRHSPLTDINAANVSRLKVAWTYRTGDISDGSAEDKTKTTLQNTPIYLFGSLYVLTPFNRIIALDLDSGQQRWVYDPQIYKTMTPGRYAARGVAAWQAAAAPGNPACQRRIFLGTWDARLIALDAMTGLPCADFGVQGSVDLSQGIGPVQRGDYNVTSPPIIVGDTVIVGSRVGDGRSVDVEPGTVRGFDARTGVLRWSWDPIPRTPQDPGYDDWPPADAARTRAANVWAPMAADPERDLVILPVSSAAPDYYGGERKGKNSHANSVVALRASTGAFVWAYQVVHHDILDYDVQAQPALTMVRHEGREVPAVALATKFGHVFVLSRETGEPILPDPRRSMVHQFLLADALQTPSRAIWRTARGSRRRPRPADG